MKSNSIIIILILIITTTIITGCSDDDIYFINSGNGTTIINNDCPTDAICQIPAYSNDIVYTTFETNESIYISYN